MSISRPSCLRAIAQLRRTPWSQLPICRRSVTSIFLLSRRSTSTIRKSTNNHSCNYRTITTTTSLTRRPIISSLSSSNFSSQYDLLNPTSTNGLSTPNTLSNSILNTIHPAQRFMQIRTAKRRTFNPSHRVRKRRHGFLSRLRTRTGRKTLNRRMEKGRTTLSH